MFYYYPIFVKNLQRIILRKNQKDILHDLKNPKLAIFVIPPLQKNIKISLKLRQQALKGFSILGAS